MDQSEFRRRTVEAERNREPAPVQAQPQPQVETRRVFGVLPSVLDRIPE